MPVKQVLQLAVHEESSLQLQTARVQQRTVHHLNAVHLRLPIGQHGRRHGGRALEQTADRRRTRLNRRHGHRRHGRLHDDIGSVLDDITRRGGDKPGGRAFVIVLVLLLDVNPRGNFHEGMFAEGEGVQIV